MKKDKDLYLKFFLYLSSIIFIVSCGNKNQEKSELKENKEKREIISEYTVLPHSTKSASIDVINDELALLLKKNKKLIYSKGKNEKIISEYINSNHYWLKSAGDYVHVFWWEKYANRVKGEENSKITGKILYVKSSKDKGNSFGSKKIITRAGSVLPQIDSVVDEHGNVTVVYLDERDNGFQIYTNSSKNGGESWGINDIRLDHAVPDETINKKFQSATSPNLESTSNQLVSLWQQRDYPIDGKPILRIYSRQSTDNGVSWEKQVLAYETTKYSSANLSLLSTDDKSYLVIELPGEGVIALTKDVNESSWNKISGVSPNSNNAKRTSYFRMAYDKKNIYITYVLVDKVKSGGKPAWHTELTRINRKTNRWMDGSYRFDSRGMGLKSRGGYQDVQVLNDGVVVVAWEDYRNILPFIGLNYSTDYGETWLRSPLSMTRQDSYNKSAMPFLKTTLNGFRVFYKNSDYPVGKKPNFKTISLELKSPKSKDFNKKMYMLKETPDLGEMKKKLRSRFSIVKQARLEKKWINEWNVKDPIYRNMFKKGSWLETRNRLIYKKFELKRVEIDFPYAYTIGSMTYDLSTDFIDAEEGDPRFANQQKQINLRWGWFGDDWYLTAADSKVPYLP